MEMRKQGNEGQGTARSASKSGGKKQSGEQTGSMSEGAASQGQGAGAAKAQSTNQPTTGHQQTSGQQGGEQDLLQHAKHAGGEIVNQVQQRAGSQINRQKETAASELSQVANAVRRLRENLGGEESGAIARYAADYGDKAADGLERLSTYIRDQDPRQLLNDVQNFGRRRPALLLGGAFLLGFAGARLIKSSMDTGSQHQGPGTNVRSSNYTGTNAQSSNYTGTSAAKPSTAPDAR